MVAWLFCWEKGGNKMRSKFFTLLVLTAISFMFILGGCGGGGGGDGGGGGSSSIAYTGEQTQAAIDESNAEDVATGALAAGQLGDAFGVLSVDQEAGASKPGSFRTLQVPLTLGNALRSIHLEILPQNIRPAEIITEEDSWTGECGGFVSYVISLNDITGEFNGSFRFSDFCEDDVVMDGNATFSGLFNFDTEDFDTATFAFDLLTVDDIEGNMTMSGDISMDFTVSPIICVIEIFARDNDTNKVYWIHNYSTNITEGPGYVEIEIFGTFYDPDHGFIRITTQEAFVVDDDDDWPKSGILICEGENNTKARLTALSAFTYRVEADTDGNGTYDWDSGIRFWTEVDASTTIAWNNEGTQTTITYDYSGGVLAGMTFHRKFDVTGSSGNVQIQATLKDRSDSVDIIDEIADTFSVMESIEYEVLVHAKVSGQGRCGPADTDKMIFSSPSASTTSEITIWPQLKYDPIIGTYDYYCPRNYAIDSIRLN
jgi:hypothetical protein